MSVTGISTALANLWLGTFQNVPYTAPITCGQLHVGDPGANGTSNISATTARTQIFFSGPSAGVITIGGNPIWAIVAAETIYYVTIWDAFTSGNFLWTGQLQVPQVVNTGDTFSLNGCKLTILGLAA
jgi:hypothetical protein